MNPSIRRLSRSFVPTALLAAMLVIFPSGCSIMDIAYEEGNGEAAEEMRELDGFQSVSVSSGIDAEVRVGEETEVRVEADSNLLEYIETVVEDGTLRIRPAGKGLMLRSKSDMVVHVSMPALEAAVASGGADLSVKGLDGGDLTISVSGGSDAKFEGRAGAVSANISGGSDLNAADLEAASFDVTASGGSDATLGKSGSLSANASGGSDICYHEDTGTTDLNDSGGSDVEPCS